MKMRKWAIPAILIFGTLAFLAYRSPYDLRLVPNKPELRAAPNAPSIKEQNPGFELSGGSERDNRGFPQRDILDLSSLFPKDFFREGSRKEKAVALTFDDGPDSMYTPQILDILQETKTRATFFLVGSRVALFPEVTKRIVDEGHVIGNHSMSHPNIAKLNNQQIKDEIAQGEEAIKQATGYHTALFRSPYGSIGPEQITLISNLNYKIISWNVDSLDWKSLSAEQVKYSILENVSSGSIVLQHSAGSKEENLSGSVGALKEIILTLKKEGYTFLTIDELLKLPYKKDP